MGLRWVGQAICHALLIDASFFSTLLALFCRLCYTLFDRLDFAFYCYLLRGHYADFGYFGRGHIKLGRCWWQMAPTCSSIEKRECYAH